MVGYGTSEAYSSKARCRKNDLESEIHGVGCERNEYDRAYAPHIDVKSRIPSSAAWVTCRCGQALSTQIPVDAPDLPNARTGENSVRGKRQPKKVPPGERCRNLLTTSV